jgi:hypothetical protein
VIAELQKTPPFKPAVEAKTNIFGKKNGRFVARFCGWEGGDNSKAAAIADLRKVMETAAKDDYTPEIFSWRGHAILLARHPVYGWGSRIIQHQGQPIETQRVSLSSGNCHDRRTAKNAVLLHLCQIGWNPHEPTPEILPPEQYGEFLRWADFQNRAHTGRTVMGLSDQDAFDYAGRNPARPELWLHLEKKQEPS